MSIKLDKIADPRLRARIEQALGVSGGDPHPPCTGGAVAHSSPESDLDEKVGDYCRAKGWYFIRARTDRRSTVAVGTPDYTIAAHGGRMLFLELKRQGGKATPAQQAAIAQLRKLGHLAYVVDNWPDALRLLEALL